MSKKKIVEELQVEATKVKAESIQKSPLEKISISARQVGKNLNVVVGNEKFTRVGDKSVLDEIKGAILAYEAKPTKSNLSTLMKLLRPETTKKEVEEVKVKAEIKATKKKVEEKEKELKSKKTVVAEVVKEIDDKMMSDEELSAMQAALDRQKAKKATAPVAKQAAIRRGGEY